DDARCTSATRRSSAMPASVPCDRPDAHRIGRPGSGRLAAMTRPPLALGAIVLAGGTAARMGGADKASIELDGRTLLAWALDAVIDADEVVVLGDWVRTERPVTFTREDPAQGGPAAGLLAGLDAFARPPARLVVLAVDMPRVSLDTVGRLRGAADGHDGAVLR